MRLAVGAVKAARAYSKAGKLARAAGKAVRFASKAKARVGRAAGVAKGVMTKSRHAVERLSRRVDDWLANGNNYVRIDRQKAGYPFRVLLGPAYNHYKKLGRFGRALNPFHVHMDSKYGGVDFNWFTKPSGKKTIARNWTWWKR